MLGATLVLLHPNGNMDLDYLLTTVQRHQVSFFNIIPSLMTILCDHLVETDNFKRVSAIRSFGFLGSSLFSFIPWISTNLISGEAIIPKTLAIMADHLNLQNIGLYNLFGPAECTLTSVYHQVTMEDIERGEIPIGRPFPNMQAFIFDEYQQHVIPGQVGELFLGGVQLSPGYFGRSDLTAQVSEELK